MHHSKAFIMKTVLKGFPFFIVIGFFLFAFTACEDDEIDNYPNKNKIYGEWQWRQSSGGFVGETIYADSVDHSLSYSFTLNSNYEYRRNDSILSYGMFNIFKNNSIHFPSPNNQLYLSNYIGSSESLTFNFSGNDTLILYDECIDCYQHLYIRK